MRSVFISYSSQDREIASKIANDLSKNGIDVWFDNWKINLGDSLIEKIEQGIKNSDYLILVLSKSSFQSAWVQKEVQAVFAKKNSGENQVIIPVLIDTVEDSQIPSYLRDIKYADLRTNYNLGINELVRTINKIDKDPKPDLDRVINISELAERVAEEALKIIRSNNTEIREKELSTIKTEENLVFVIISFSSDMEPIFEGIKAAGDAHSLKVIRVKDIVGDYRITDKIIENIHAAKFIVADLTHERPNVYFELGYARGLNKKVITVAKETSKLHFDIKDWTCEFYNDSRVLEKYLHERFKVELNKA